MMVEERIGKLGGGGDWILFKQCDVAKTLGGILRIL